MKGYNRLLILSLLLSLAGCKGLLSPAEYVAWIADETNGLRKSKTLNKVRFEVQYKPVDFVIAKEYLRSHPEAKSIPKAEYDKRKEELAGMEYFDLRIHPPEGHSSIVFYGLTHPSESQERLNYFSFEMQRDLLLEIPNWKSKPQLFHFERSYDLAPFRTFLIGFPATKEKPEEMTFVFNCRHFNTGPVKFKFQKEQISNLPQIAIE